MSETEEFVNPVEWLLDTWSNEIERNPDNSVWTFEYYGQTDTIDEAFRRIQLIYDNCIWTMDVNTERIVASRKSSA